MFIFKNYVKRAKTELGDDGGSGGKAPENETIDDKEEQDWKKLFNDSKDELARIKSKNDELLGETKRAKQRSREAEQTAQQESEERARKAGDFEQLFKSSELQKSDLQKQLESLQDSISNEKKETVVLKLAAELAEGDDVENLAYLIKDRLKYHEGEIKVLNSKGELTVSSLNDLKAEIQSTSRFKSLLKGSQATGGSANGNRASSSTSKTVSRSDFDAMGNNQRAKFIKDGGKVTN